MKIICFDLDGVICNNTYGDYSKAKPIKKSINKINSLYNKGHIIKVFTARYMGRNNEDISKAYTDGYKFTKNQLDSWGLKYHFLILGKPTYDILVDDKHIGFSKVGLKIFLNYYKLNLLILTNFN